MEARRQRWARGALVACIIGLIGIAPELAAGKPEPPPRPTVPRGVGPAFRVALSRPQGPVIEWASRNATASVVAGNPVRGTFGPQLSWPIVPIHAVLLPDGRVLSYGSDRNGLQTGYYDYDIWDPALGVDSTAHTTLPNRSGTDLFCNTQTLLLDGNVEMFGGDNIPASTQTFNNHVDLFRTSDRSLNRTGTMKRKRWYASSTVLPNGEILLQGGSGGKDFPEVRAVNGTFRLLTGASTNALYSGYPRNFVAPDGKVFGISVRDMYRINPAGTGTITDLGDYPMNNVGPMSTPAMFAAGKILQVGGHDGRQTSIIDIGGAAPTVTAMPKVARARKWSTATVMADGRVFVSGGSAENNTATNVSYTAEIFNPATNTWSDGATAQRMRLYHSTSLLMRDGTVLTMGGGVPGPETNLNAEIYYPSYLFASDGSPALRPTIDAATTAAEPGASLLISTQDAASISQVSLVKMGSVTHSVDMDMRFMKLPFSADGSSLAAQLPANRYLTPPGHYMLFIFDQAGVPSLARVVKIGLPGS
jgi:hypothetical protein